MLSAIRRLIIAASILAAIGAFPIGTASAEACPNCKVANEENERRPKAYMYSILFMISMPAMIFTGFSLSFYRMARRAQKEQEALIESELS